jgi:hypothetical protein
MQVLEMHFLSNAQRRINETMLSRVGRRASEIEYQVLVNRVWTSAWMLVSFLIGAVAKAVSSWPLGGLAIALYLVAGALTIRHFVLRHRFFQAASLDLGTKVTMRHPVRGYPNWRRQLSDEQLRRLDKQYATWCAARGIAGLRNVPRDETPSAPD